MTGNNSIKKNCIVCGANLKYLIKRIDSSYQILYCLKCSLIASDPIPSRTFLRKFYTAFQFKNPSEKKFKEFRNDAFQDAKLYLKQIVKISSKRSLNSSTLLDYGGSVGYFSKAFSKLGFKVTNTDIDRISLKFCRERFGKSVKTKILNNKIRAYKKFDYIFCREVIEHIPNPNSLLINIKRFMHDESILILTTPNQATWEYFFRIYWWYRYLRVTNIKSKLIFSLLKFMRKPWICCDPPRHLYSFNYRNLPIIFKKNGYEILLVHTYYTNELAYSDPKYRDFSMQKITDFFQVVSNIYFNFGLKILHFIDFNKLHGTQTIALVRKKR